MVTGLLRPSACQVDDLVCVAGVRRVLRRVGREWGGAVLPSRYRRRLQNAGDGSDATSATHPHALKDSNTQRASFKAGEDLRPMPQGAAAAAPSKSESGSGNNVLSGCQRFLAPQNGQHAAPPLVTYTHPRGHRPQTFLSHRGPRKPPLDVFTRPGATVLARPSPNTLNRPGRRCLAHRPAPPPLTNAKTPDQRKERVPQATLNTRRWYS